MPTIKAHKAIKTLLLCTLLLTPKPLKPMLHRTLDLTLSQSYAIVCFASFCIGAVVCSLLHKYNKPQTIITPKKTNVEKTNAQKKLLEPLKTDISSVGTEQQKIMTILTEQNKELAELKEKLANLENNLITEKKPQLPTNADLLVELNTFHKTHNNLLHVFLTLYWANKSIQQAQEIEEYKSKPNNLKIDLLTQ